MITRKEMIENYLAHKTKEALENLAEKECEKSRDEMRKAGLSELYNMGEPDVFHSFAIPTAGRIYNDADTGMTGEENLHDEL